MASNTWNFFNDISTFPFIPKGSHYLLEYFCNQIRSDQISRSVVSDSLWPHESQHARPPHPSPTPGVHWDSGPSSQWCHNCFLMSMPGNFNIFVISALTSVECLLLEKYVKAVYCHLDYLTYMQGTSWETLGCMKHKLESRLLAEISITSDLQITPPLWQKAKKN